MFGEDMLNECFLMKTNSVIFINKTPIYFSNK